MATWYERNREKALAYQNAYMKEHRDNYLAYQKIYYQEVLKPKREERARQKYMEKAVSAPPIQPLKEPVKTPIQKKKDRSPPIKKVRKPREVWRPQIRVSTGEFILRFD